MRFFFAFLFVLTALMCDASAHDRDAIDERSEWVLTEVSGLGFQGLDQKNTPYFILAWTKNHGCSYEYSEYMVGLVGKKFTDNGYDVFYLPPLVRYLYLFKKCMNTDQLERVKIGLGNKFPLYTHGTLNHAVMKASSIYLLAQLFPDLVWQNSDFSKIKSEDLIGVLSERLKKRTKKFFEDGECEQNSPTYAMANLMSVLNIFDFSNDKNLARYADAEATLIVSILKAESYHGRLVPPLARAHAPQQANPRESSGSFFPAISQHILWLYFGEPILESHDFVNMREPPFVTMLALSEWRPPVVIENLDKYTGVEYEISSITPSFSIWGDETNPEIFEYRFFSKNYSVGSGNISFSPGGSYETLNAFGITYRNRRLDSIVDCYHPYWQSNKEIGYWGPDRSSPFQQVVQVKNRGVMIFDIPNKDPFVVPGNKYYKLRDLQEKSLLQYVKCRIPQDVGEIRVKNNSIYVNDGVVFYLIRALKGSVTELLNDAGSVSQYHVFVVDGSDAALYFRVEESSRFKNFDEFISESVTDAKLCENGFVCFKGPDGENVRSAFGQVKQVGGRIYSLPKTNVDLFRIINSRNLFFNSAFLRIGSGRLEVIRDGKSVYKLEPRSFDRR